MKLIKQISLHYQQGTSDKVYEVDLCEVTVTSDQPARYVVNFRYGRRGTTLRDGTKTAAPVDRDQAQRIFSRLVSSKLNKGYQYAAGSDVLDDSLAGTPPVRPAGEQPQSAADRPEKPDPRAEAVLQRIAEGHQSKAQWPLSRAVWRAGELGLKQAESLLLPLIGTGSVRGRSPDQPMLDYSIAAALARCGTQRSVPALRGMLSDKRVSAMVRRMAAEALLQLLDAPSRQALVQDAIGHLPPPLVEPARDGPAELFAERLTAYLQDGGDTSLVDALYRIDNQHVRPALLELLRTAPLEPPYFQRLRHVFKAAELRRDGEVFGLLAYRFEKERATFRNTRYSYYGRSSAKSTVGPDAEKAFAFETKLYLRRRVWRTLSRLGELEDTDYVPMAVGVLLPFTDEDAQPPHSTVRYDWSAYQRTRRVTSNRVHSDSYALYWAFSQILYAYSTRYRPDSRRRYFECIAPFEPGGPEPDEREEAFPALWQAAPQGLLHLLNESRCEAVHRFAAKALRTCTDFCVRLDVEAILMLLAAPYAVTNDLGFQLAVSRYDPTAPDKSLVLALANCDLERARVKAHQWIQAGRIALFRDMEFIVSLVTARFPDTRAVARESLRTIALDESTAHAIIGRLIASLQSLTDGDGPLAADVAETMLLVFGRQLRRIGPEVIRDLLGHELPEVQRLAGDLVLNHDRLAQQPPEDVLRALLGAGNALVREVGVRIIGQLPDDVLKRSIDVLAALSRSEHPDVRDAIRPVVRRLALADRALATRIAGMLVEALLVPGAPEGVPSHTCRLLREDFRDHLASISAETVFRLLDSRSGPAQEVGGMLLATNVRPSEITVERIVKLAGSEILSVRQAAWRMCREGVDRLRREAATAVRLLDARWEDSRQFGFQLFRERFTVAELTPAILVSICDSMRPDVQQFGREMITRLFQEEFGHEYLTRLSEHPSTAMQAFNTNFLDRYAADNPERLQELTPYFLSVLSRVNKGRVAKQRVLDFLQREATKSEAAAQTVAEILTRQSATGAIGDRARTIEIMNRLRTVYPDLPLPLTVRPVEARGGV